MENGSSSGSQGQGSHNLTGGPGGNNGNGPNPGNTNFNGLAAAEGGNNRENSGNPWWDTVLLENNPPIPPTDTDKLADFLEKKYEEFKPDKPSVKGPAVNGDKVGLRLCQTLALKQNTIYYSMVYSYLDYLYPNDKTKIFPKYNEKRGTTKAQVGYELTREVIDNIRAQKKNVSPEFKKS